VSERLPVTLCISTRNAGSVLPGCIESCREWISEVVIVDMESEDDTLDVAENYGARVVNVPNAGWAEPGRQAGIDAAGQPWILVLDADERATPGVRAIAERAVEDGSLNGVWLPRQNFMFGRWHRRSGIWPDPQLRLFRRAATTWPAVWTHAGPKVEGRVIHAEARTENAIVHQSFQSIRDWMVSANRYTDHEADRLRKAGKRGSLVRLVTLPPARFLELYVWRRGFLSGRYGLTIALLSFCYWVLAELKLWERE
jgi:glycosyltransferase involved in cell wall biosynthesis